MEAQHSALLVDLAGSVGDERARVSQVINITILNNTMQEWTRLEDGFRPQAGVHSIYQPVTDNGK